MLPLVFAAELPSLFRGVVVTDSPLGVRVVSVEEATQAALADLRPEDLIVRIQEDDVRTIEEFAAVSTVMKGKTKAATLVIFRNGAPRTLTLHLYSYPLLREWGVQFLPNYDFRFAEPEVGRDYWFRLGRGFEQAGKPAEALDAYLNALHNLPVDAEMGLKAALLFARQGQSQMRSRQLVPALASLRDGITMMEHLFDYPLTEVQLRLIKTQLQETLHAIKEATHKQ
ncbi:MAG: PDZ domain-containing protein [Candidatus Omnitrophica bacterium]|nr:PDZ domain-containing protein [Candidatus Omnitrophota bacterium]